MVVLFIWVHLSVTFSPKTPSEEKNKFVEIYQLCNLQSSIVDGGFVFA